MKKITGVKHNSLHTTVWAAIKTAGTDRFMSYPDISITWSGHDLAVSSLLPGQSVKTEVQQILHV